MSATEENHQTIGQDRNILVEARTGHLPNADSEQYSMVSLTSVAYKPFPNITVTASTPSHRDVITNLLIAISIYMSSSCQTESKSVP